MLKQSLFLQPSRLFQRLSTQVITATSLLRQIKRIQVINEPANLVSRRQDDLIQQKSSISTVGSDLSRGAVGKILHQYRQLKTSHPNYMVLMQVGDFFEVFDGDAERASKILEIGLCNNRYGTQMTGVPTRSLESYLERLVKADINVMIVEQVSSGRTIQRRISRFVTKGTLTEDALLESSSNNFICCIEAASGGDEYALSWIDISTGYFRILKVQKSELLESLQVINPREIIALPNSIKVEEELLRYSSLSGASFNEAPQLKDQNNEALTEIFDTDEATGLEETFDALELQAIKRLITFIIQTQVGRRPFIEIPQRFNTKKTMKLDAAALRSLEIVYNNSTGTRENSLLSVIDCTSTAAGSRLLSQRIVAPLRELDAISSRLDQVEFFCQNFELAEMLTKTLKECRDMERSFQRLALGRSVGGPKDMLIVKQTLQAAQSLRIDLALKEHSVTLSYISRMESCADIIELIEEAIVESPPSRPSDGGLIKHGFCDKLDGLRVQSGSLEEQSKDLVDDYRKSTGKASLKLSSRKTLGLLLEVHKSEGPITSPKFILDSVIGDKYRYRTTELETLNAHSNNRGEEIVKEEVRIYEEIRQMIVTLGKRIMQIAHTIAELDVAVASAILAVKRGYVRPSFSDDDFIILAGRHPVVEEKHLEVSRPFTFNDCNLSSHQRFALITGPNMGGKSTFLRQNAIIPILAQIGMYVPASCATLPLFDAIFTRIGASDDLARNKSTFMVEMGETASILLNASSQSLVIMDEIGRGTAAAEGYALAKAICEYLYRRGCRTLFATHYTKLAELKDHLNQMQFLMTSAEMIDGDICFLHRILPGVAEQSHAIDVAKIAGIPLEVIEAARENLQYKQ